MLRIAEFALGNGPAALMAQALERCSRSNACQAGSGSG